MDDKQKLDILRDFVLSNKEGVEISQWRKHRFEDGNLRLWQWMRDSHRIEVLEQNYGYILDYLMRYHDEQARSHMQKVGEYMSTKQQFRIGEKSAITE